MKKPFIILIIIIIITIVIQSISTQLIPAIKTIAAKEINRFCQMIINNTPFPKSLDYKKLISITRNNNEIAAINFNTNYAATLASMLVNSLEEVFYAIEENRYQATDNSFYQRKLQLISDRGYVVSVKLGSLTNNPFLVYLGPSLPLKYQMISAITSSIDDDIQSYGVNHMMISLKIVITVKLLVILPFYQDEFKHLYDYPLVLEIIEGEVPNWYQN